MIGSETLAEEIANAVLILDEFGDVDVDHSLIPDGWEYIASGAMRHAFLGPDGFVYKVNLEDDANEFSWDEYTEMMEIISSDKVRIAETDYFTDCCVMVQEYIDGKKPVGIRNLSDLIRDALNGRWIDLHWGNVRIVDDVIVIIDW